MVIGAGVLGASVAWQLARSDWDVTIVDRYPIGHARAASNSHTRQLRFAHGDAVADTRSAVESLRLWRELEEATGRSLVLEVGQAWFAHEDDSWEAASRAVLEGEGIAVERIEPADAGKLFPDLATADLNYVLFEPGACALRAAEAVRALCEDAVAHGTRLATGMALPREGAAELDGQRLAADRTVWACGSWTPALFPELVEGTVIQQDLCFFEGPPAWCSPGVPGWAEADGSAWGLGAVAGAGFKVGADRPGPTVDPDDERRPDPAQGRAARSYLARRFPGVAGAPLAAVECWPTTVDVGDGDAEIVLAAEQRVRRHPGAAGTWILGDGSGSAFKHGPAIGHRMAELLDTS